MTLQEFEAKVLNNDYCIGCGVCAASEPASMSISLTEHGYFKASVREDRKNSNSNIGELCPFSGESHTEDEIAASLFPRAPGRHPVVGRYSECYAGSVTDPDAYARSSSGGVAKWILRRLLEDKHVDAVVHVTETPAESQRDSHYQYAVARTVAEIENGSKSAYYPVEMSRVLEYVRQTPGRYAITGVPCFIKAIRNLCRVDPVFAERIVFTVGIVCGHLKSKYYAEMIGWQLGVNPSDLARIDFRVKIPGRRANEKGVWAHAISTSQPSPQKTVQQLFGTNYGHGLFKYNACDYCDDIMAETSDISIGDAWLPEYLAKGTSLVVVRNDLVGALVGQGRASGQLELHAISSDRAAASQDAGVRHRREGLSYRLHLKARRHHWFPRKRLEPAINGIALRNRLLYRLRLELAARSPQLFSQAKRLGSWRWFRWRLAPAVKLYSYCYRFPRVWNMVEMVYRRRADKGTAP